MISLQSEIALVNPHQPRNNDLTVPKIESTSMRKAITNLKTRTNCTVLSSRVSLIIPAVQKTAGGDGPKKLPTKIKH